MLKRILVPTDGSEHAAVGVRYAVALAKRHNATVLGLHVIDVKLLEGPFLRDLSASLGTAPYVNYQGNIAMVLEERGKAALADFRQLCEAQGVSCETEILTGIVPRGIIEKSTLADLIVLGRGGEHSQFLEGLVGSTTEAVVRRANMPVLVTGTDTPGGERFVLAYDGSSHAKKGLRTAVGIAEEWGMSFHILVVGGAEKQALLEEALRYVQSYNVDVQAVRREGDCEEEIVKYLTECEADLLVMGAYGHTKVRELFVGSTTAYALNHAPCPVLLSR